MERFAHFAGEDGLFSSEYLEFKVLMRIPARNVQRATVYRNPNLGERSGLQVWI